MLNKYSLAYFEEKYGSISLWINGITPKNIGMKKINSQKTKKHYSTTDRSSAFGVGFAFSFDHPEWAKGNFLLCSVFLARRRKLFGESHPPSQNPPQTADKYQILEEKSSSRPSRTRVEKRA